MSQIPSQGEGVSFTAFMTSGLDGRLCASLAPIFELQLGKETPPSNFSLVASAPAAVPIQTLRPRTTNGRG